MLQDPHELWAQCLLNMERQVRPISFDTWFRPTRARRFDANDLVIQVPTSFFADYVESHYLKRIQTVVEEVTALAPKVTFIVAHENASATSTAASVAPSVAAPFSSPLPTPPPLSGSDLPPPAGPTRPTPAEGDLSSALHFTPLNERYTFETFVIGEGNRFAHAAAQDVARSPGKTQYNPLVIYGGVGLGKTHLLQAIGHCALAQNSAHKVAYVTSEKFMNDFVEGIKTGTIADFKRRYRNADILLVDDIQFLLKGEKTQDEFFHTFNALHQSGKQIVMTCDSPPEKLEGLEERLISRFQWGLVTRIGPPDLETRIAILRQKAEISGIQLPDEVAAFLGNFVNSNVRELEGALIHLMAYCSVNRSELSVEAARQIVEERGPAHTSHVSIEGIQQQVVEHFGLTSELLIGKTRTQEVATARQIAMFLAKSLTQSPLKTIGLHFGGRDHSTVIHAIKTVQSKSNRDPSFARVVESLTTAIQDKFSPS